MNNANNKGRDRASLLRSMMSAFLVLWPSRLIWCPINNISSIKLATLVKYRSAVGNNNERFSRRLSWNLIDFER